MNIKTGFQTAAVKIEKAPIKLKLAGGIK